MANLFEEKLHGIVHVIKESCHGVVLSQRGHGDPHIMFNTIIEDDENWGVDSGSSSSSAWLEEHVAVMKRALEWVEKHCKKENHSCGWFWNG